MQTNLKTQKYKITPLIYGTNFVGMGHIEWNKPSFMRELKKKYPLRIVTFSYSKHAKSFIARLEKKFFKKYKKPIYSKIFNHARKVTIQYGVMN